MITLQSIRDECRCEDVRDKCAVCGKSCKLIDLVWDTYRNKVVCYDCDTETQASNAKAHRSAPTAGVERKEKYEQT